MELYSYSKALHIIFVVCWFAGLFYIVRLFIYDVEANQRPNNEKQILQMQLRLMQRRLWYGITWPSAILAGFFGFSLLHPYFPLINHPWLMAKLSLVGLLYAYHMLCGHIFSQLQKGLPCNWSSLRLRLLNEGATLFLVSIVSLVVVRESMGVFKFLAILTILSLLLFFGVQFYKKRRSL